VFLRCQTEIRHYVTNQRRENDLSRGLLIKNLSVSEQKPGITGLPAGLNVS
jgi:hypothetical protein